jgi:hypothetical protein
MLKLDFGGRPIFGDAGAPARQSSGAARVVLG